jgi:hypothetical protein
MEGRRSGADALQDQARDEEDGWYPHVQVLCHLKLASNKLGHT